MEVKEWASSPGQSAADVHLCHIAPSTTKYCPIRQILNFRMCHTAAAWREGIRDEVAIGALNAESQNNMYGRQCEIRKLSQPSKVHSMEKKVQSIVMWGSHHSNYHRQGSL